MRKLIKSIRIVILFIVACIGMHWGMSTLFASLGDIQYAFVSGCLGIALFAGLILIFAEKIAEKTE